MLSDAQKANRVVASTSLLRQFSDNPDPLYFTVEETCHSDPASKTQCMAWKQVSSFFSTPPRKFHVVMLACKVMATVSWNAEGIVLTSNVPAQRAEHSPLHNGLGLTPAAAVRLARRHARPINALGDDQPTLSALYYD